MQSMNPFISNELFSWMSIWSHELLVSDSGGQEEEKEAEPLKALQKCQAKGGVRQEEASRIS